MPNTNPSLTGLAPAVTFVENTVNAAPQLLVPDVTFLDPDNNFNGGTLSLSGLLAEDTASIRDQGAGAGLIQFDSGTGIVSYGGVAIGTASGGAGSTLTVIFNAGATSAAIEALVENLTYANASNTPTASRDLEIRITDAAGAAAVHQTSFGSAVPGPFAGIFVGDVSAPAFTDLDGDGDLDLVVGERDGNLNYYRNDGTATAPIYIAVTDATNPFAGISVGSFGASTPAFADIDGDGDLDLVVGESDGPLNYYRNDGTPTAPDYVAVTDATNPFAGINVGFVSTPALADLDGDGDFDLVVGENDGTLNYYRNDGKATAPDYVYVAANDATNPLASIDVGTVSKPAFADLDGDGDLDLIVGEYQGSLNYYRNTGTATAPNYVAVSDSTNSLPGIIIGFETSPIFADLDGDGDLDLVVGELDGNLNYFTNTTPHQAAPGFAQATGPANPVAVVDLGVSGVYSTPALADLDGDGDLDLVVGERVGTLNFYRNDGTTTAPTFATVSAADDPFATIDVGSYSAPTFGDIDGDGDLDLIVGNESGGLSFYENTGTAIDPGYTIASGVDDPFAGIDIGSRSKPVLADLDSDGDLDLVVGDESGGLSFYENTGTATAPRLELVFGPENPFADFIPGVLNSENAPAFADLDGDGDLDLVVGRYGGFLNFSRNIGTATAPDFAAPVLIAAGGSGLETAPAFADLDGDGDLDLVVGEAMGVLTYHRNTPGFEFTVGVTAENDAPVIVLNPALDFVVLHSKQDTLGVLLNDGSGFLAPVAAFAAGNDPRDIDAGDVNGDGIADLVVADHGNEEFAVLIGDGFGGFGAPASFQSFGTGINRVALGDLNGDGLLDVAAATVNRIRLFAGDGHGGFGAAPFATIITDTLSSATSDLDLADVNNDGRLDVVITDKGDNTVSVSLALAGGGFGPQTSHYTGGNFPTGTSVYDVNGDGWLDFVTANSANNSLSPGNIGIVLADGAGGFLPAATFDAGFSHPMTVALGDVNGDGQVDIAIANIAQTISLFLGDGTGSFSPVFTAANLGSGLYGLQLVDLTGDGKLDIAYTVWATDTVNIMAGDGLGAFGNPTAFDAGDAGDFVEWPSTLAELNPLASDLTDAKTFTEGATVKILPDVSLADADGTTLAGAILAITGGFALSGDLLAAVTTGTAITASFASGVLSLTGTDSVAHYQQVLRSVTFSSGEDPDNGGANQTRNITLTVNDGFAGGVGATATITVGITAVNDAPSGADKDITATEDIARALTRADFGFSDVDGSFAAVRIVTPPGAGKLTLDGIDVTANQLISVADLDAGKLSFVGALNAAGAAYAQLAFQTQDNDGALDPTPNTLTIDISAVNDAPTAASFANIHAPIAENASTKLPIKIADIVITDIDGGNNLLTLSGADAALFQLIGGDLFLKAGAKLDFETNAKLDVTVNVNDPSIGGAVDAQLSLSIAVRDVIENLTGTPLADRLIGTNNYETINGLGGNDLIYGLGGNDRIIGGLGVDRLTGGAGADMFVFNSILDSGPGQSGLVNGILRPVSGQGLRDVITDFTHGVDKINLSAIDANLAMAGNQAFTWRGTGNFSRHSGELIERLYNPAGTVNDKTIIYGDINGDARADFQIELSGLKTITVSDLLL